MSEWRETEIGKLPINWEYQPLEYFFDKITYGFTNPMPTTEEGPYMITAKDVNGGRIKYETARRTSKEAFENLLTPKSRPEINDVLITKDGSIGRVGIVDKTNLCINQSVALIRPNGKIRPLFLKYLLETPIYQKLIERDADGSTIKHIYITRINQMFVGVPSLEEQDGILGIIHTIQNKIFLLRKQNQTLEEVAQTLFKRWFVEFNFPDKDGNPYKSSGGRMVDSELGEIPEGWQLSTVGENIETSGGGTPSTKEPSYWENDNILWYSPTDLTKQNSVFSNGSEKFITQLGLHNSSAKLFPAYSLMMTSRATVGEIAINTSDACTNQGFITLIPNEKLSVYFLYVWLKTKLRIVHNLASGSTFPEISKTDFRNIGLLLANGEVHKRFDHLFRPIFKSIENNTKEIQTLTQLRDTLLPKLMSGEIRVTGKSKK